MNLLLYEWINGSMNEDRRLPCAAAAAALPRPRPRPRPLPLPLPAAVTAAAAAATAAPAKRKLFNAIFVMYLVESSVQH